MNNFKWLLMVPLATLLSLSFAAGKATGNLSVKVDGDKAFVTARNASESPLRVWERTTLAGRGGGNLLFLAVNDLGQVAQPCAFVSSPVGSGRPMELSYGNEKEVWRGNLRTLSKLYCLEPGSYIGSFVYVSPGKEFLFSPSFKFDVASN